MIKLSFSWESYKPLISVCDNQMLLKITLGSIYEITMSNNALVLSQSNGNNAIEVHVSFFL